MCGCVCIIIIIIIVNVPTLLAGYGMRERESESVYTCEAADDGIVIERGGVCTIIDRSGLSERERYTQHTAVATVNGTE